MISYPICLLDTTLEIGKLISFLRVLRRVSWGWKVETVIIKALTWCRDERINILTRNEEVILTRFQLVFSQLDLDRKQSRYAKRLKVGVSSWQKRKRKLLKNDNTSIM
jgi:hypothetical protein